MPPLDSSGIQRLQLELVNDERSNDSNTPAGNSNEHRAIENLRSEVFQIITDRGIARTSAGFRLSDGRLMTTYTAIKPAIEKKTEIIAQRDGLNWKLGNPRIDDVKDLAILEFIGTQPPTSPGLKFEGKSDGVMFNAVNERDIVPGTKVTVIGGFSTMHGPSINTSAIKDCLRQETFPGNGSLHLEVDSKVLSDALAFSRRPLLQIPLGQERNLRGSPVISNGLVIGIATAEHDGYVYATPASDMYRFLCEPSDSPKIVSHSGWESGFTKYCKDWKRAPGESFDTTAVMAGTALGLIAYSKGVSVGLVGAALPGTYHLFKDYCAYKGSTTKLDSIVHGLSFAGDVTELAGIALCLAGSYAPGLRRVGLSTTLLGLATRTATGLIPNQYIVNSVERTDGSRRNLFSAPNP